MRRRVGLDAGRRDGSEPTTPRHEYGDTCEAVQGCRGHKHAHEAERRSVGEDQRIHDETCSEQDARGREERWILEGANSALSRRRGRIPRAQPRTERTKSMLAFARTFELAFLTAARRASGSLIFDRTILALRSLCEFREAFTFLLRRPVS